MHEIIDYTKNFTKMKMPVKRSKSLSDAPTACQMHQLPVKCITILEVTYFDVDELSDYISFRKPPTTPFINLPIQFLSDN
jgi:hypothetical protein